MDEEVDPGCPQLRFLAAGFAGEDEHAAAGGFQGAGGFGAAGGVGLVAAVQDRGFAAAGAECLGEARGQSGGVRRSCPCSTVSSPAAGKRPAENSARARLPSPRLARKICGRVARAAAASAARRRSSKSSAGRKTTSGSTTVASPAPPSASNRRPARRRWRRRRRRQPGPAGARRGLRVRRPAGPRQDAPAAARGPGALRRAAGRRWRRRSGSCAAPPRGGGSAASSASFCCTVPAASAAARPPSFSMPWAIFQASRAKRVGQAFEGPAAAGRIGHRGQVAFLGQHVLRGEREAAAGRLGPAERRVPRAGDEAIGAAEGGGEGLGGPAQQVDPGVDPGGVRRSSRGRSCWWAAAATSPAPLAAITLDHSRPGGPQLGDLEENARCPARGRKGSAWPPGSARCRALRAPAGSRGRRRGPAQLPRRGGAGAVPGRGRHQGGPQLGRLGEAEGGQLGEPPPGLAEAAGQAAGGGEGAQRIAAEAAVKLAVGDAGAAHARPGRARRPAGRPGRRRAPPAGISARLRPSSAATAAASPKARPSGGPMRSQSSWAPSPRSCWRAWRAAAGSGSAISLPKNQEAPRRGRSVPRVKGKLAGEPRRVAAGRRRFFAVEGLDLEAVRQAVAERLLEAGAFQLLLHQRAPGAVARGGKLVLVKGIAVAHCGGVYRAAPFRPATTRLWRHGANRCRRRSRSRRSSRTAPPPGGATPRARPGGSRRAARRPWCRAAPGRRPSRGSRPAPG